MKTVICVDKDKKEYEVPVSELTIRPSIYGVIIQENKVLLTRQWDGYSFPGGAVEKGEDMYEALVREIREETGLEVKVGEVVACENSFFKWMGSYWHTILIFRRCEVAGGRLSIEGLEEIEKGITKDLPEWVPIEDLEKIKFYTTVDNVKIIKRALEL